MKDKTCLMKKLQSSEFDLIETVLYLDAYPTETKALEHYYEAKDTYDKFKKEYTEQYGPLTSYDNNGNSWDWINSPWPWQYEV